MPLFNRFHAYTPTLRESIQEELERLFVARRAAYFGPDGCVASQFGLPEDPHELKMFLEKEWPMLDRRIFSVEADVSTNKSTVLLEATLWVKGEKEPIRVSFWMR